MCGWLLCAALGSPFAFMASHAPQVEGRMLQNSHPQLTQCSLQGEEPQMMAGQGDTQQASNVLLGDGAQEQEMHTGVGTGTQPGLLRGAEGLFSHAENGWLWAPCVYCQQ